MGTHSTPETRSRSGILSLASIQPNWSKSIESRHLAARRSLKAWVLNHAASSSDLLLTMNWKDSFVYEGALLRLLATLRNSYSASKHSESVSRINSIRFLRSTPAWSILYRIKSRQFGA